MVARIGLLGGECTGKSSLARALALALPACVVEEELRDFVDREGRVPRREDQPALLRAQAQAEEAIAARCLEAVLVADPAPLMTAVYSLLYFDDPSLVPAGVDHAGGYDLVVWCDPGIPWTPDGDQRDGPQERDRADDVIARLVADELAPRGIRVLRVAGGLEERVAAVRRAWQPGPPDPRT
jgi:nicotinamide riboside kinase